VNYPRERQKIWKEKESFGNLMKSYSITFLCFHNGIFLFNILHIGTINRMDIDLDYIFNPLTSVFDDYSVEDSIYYLAVLCFASVEKPVF